MSKIKTVDGGGLRYNDNKNPVDLVPPSLILAVGEVFGAGAKKYAPRNWERGMAWTKVYGCLMRHILKWASPFHSDLDEETGLSHLAHAATNVAMLIEYDLTCKELDDRIKIQTTEDNTVKAVDAKTEEMLDDLNEEFGSQADGISAEEWERICKKANIKL